MFILRIADSFMCKIQNEKSFLYMQSKITVFIISNRCEHKLLNTSLQELMICLFRICSIQCAAYNQFSM